MRNARSRARRFVVAGAAVAALAVPTAAGAIEADPCVNASPSDTSCGGTDQVVEPGAEVQGETVANSAAGGSLPVTGGDVAGLAAVGAGLTAVGIVLARQGRRRRTTT